MIKKFCYYYQIKDKASRYLKFTLKKNVDFNNKIIIDSIYLDKKPILYFIDLNITFQLSRFLNNISAKKILETLCQYWIDTYFSSSNIIAHDI